MLWIFGVALAGVWLIAKFVFHKGGMVHVLLMIAGASFIIQFAQDRRTKAYERSLTR
jgi:Family of unknown function (DUF5670)